MKKLFLILILLPLSISAQQYPEMAMGNQGEMQKMMETMQKMQACMMKINKDDLAEIKRKAEKMKTESQALCSKGKRHQAQQNAKEAINQFKDDPAVLELRKCTSMLEKMSTEHKVNEVHVCDSSGDLFK